MDTVKGIFTKKNAFLIMLGTAVLLMSGCKFQLTNLTPKSLKSNPSNIYTITLQVNYSTAGNIVKGTMEPRIIIDGKAFKMKPSAAGEGLYEYDYSMPANRSIAKYYFIVRYRISGKNGEYDGEKNTQAFDLKVENRYTVSLEVDRAPVGTRIAILGRGFTREDKVFIDNQKAATLYQSPTSIAFYVPPVTPGLSYEVHVVGANGQLSVGTLRVDPSKITVSPTVLNLTSGRRKPLAFTIPVSAQPGGLPVSVTTDVPDSIIMPEVSIEGGQRSTSIIVEGGEAGSGNLYVSIPGYGEIVVPVTVSE